MSLNIDNFFSYYAVHVFDTDKTGRYQPLKPNEKAIALVCSVALGIFTLGLYHLVLKINEWMSQKVITVQTQSIHSFPQIIESGLLEHTNLKVQIEQQDYWHAIENSPELKQWFETEFCARRKNIGYRVHPGSLLPLSETQIRQAKQFYETLSSMPKNHILENENIWIQAGEVLKLAQARLSDEGVDVILAILHKTSFCPDVYVKSSRTYETLIQWPETDVFARRPEQILNNGKMFIPIIQGTGVSAHATLIVADFKAKTMQHFDSLGSPGLTTMKTVADWLNRLRKRKGGEAIDWQISIPKHGSKQDLDDCTIFTIRFFEILLKEDGLKQTDSPYDFKFDAQNVPYYRLILLYRLSEFFKTQQMQ